MPTPAAPAARADDEVAIRRVASLAEYAECVAIQRETWGADFAETVPAAILMVAQKVGGVTAAAFAPGGRMLGFVFGITGVREGQPVHWSDLLAVRPEARGRGIGARLKEFQRDCLRAAGVGRMYWTYDPLVARNARLNLARLGARATEYVCDMYGASTGSVLHEGIGTDRFVVEWDLADPAAGGPRPDARAHAHDDRCVVNAPDTPGGRPRVAALPDADCVCVEIPPDLAGLLTTDPRRARDWRETTRECFTWYLGRGYRVTGLAYHDDRPAYVLERAR